MEISSLLKIGWAKFFKNKMNEINFFLIVIYILIQLKCLFILPSNLYGWHSECIAIVLFTTIMHCDLPLFNWVKEVENTHSVQWSVTLCLTKSLRHVRSVYCIINMALKPSTSWSKVQFAIWYTNRIIAKRHQIQFRVFTFTLARWVKMLTMSTS